jgi:hypothetical protein
MKTRSSKMLVLKFAGLVLSFALATPVLSSIQSDSRTAEQEIYGDSDGYAVLSLLLDPGAINTSEMQIYFRTIAGMNSESCRSVPVEFRYAFKNFQERNKSPQRLAREFSMNAKYELVEKVQVSLPPPAPGELEVPNEMINQPTLYSVSLVGFDKTRTHAVAYVQVVCGGECAHAAHHLLLRDKHGWRETRNSPICKSMY